jgi:hypothetical protein
MRNEGVCLKAFSLSCRPPKLFKGNARSRRSPTPIFQPYREALPLESGYYSYVIDNQGRFRVVRGNTSSHSGMGGDMYIGAAGHFWIARSGKLGMAYCGSNDHWLYFQDEHQATVRFVINAFSRHQAFDLSKHAYFKFFKERFQSFIVTIDGQICQDETERRQLIEAEGQGKPTTESFCARKIDAFLNYSPIRPVRLYAMKSDQAGPPVDYDSFEDFEYGPSAAPYRVADGPLSSGKKAFILNEEGWLVIGSGHHLLSGGNCVGAAGQLFVDDRYTVREISLNFSGHYRPPLSADYVRYTYRSLYSHPLLTLGSDCRISARKNFDVNGLLEMISFRPDELLSDNPELDYQLEPPTAFDQPYDEDDGLIWR